MSKKIRFSVRALAVVGITLALYLLYEQWTQPATTLCSINSVVNCDAIIKGAVAKTLGLPTPLFGLIGYTIIFFAATYSKKKLLLWMASFGLLFCLWIAYQELVILRTVCPVCILCQVIMSIIFFLAIYVSRKEYTSLSS